MADERKDAIKAKLGATRQQVLDLCGGLTEAQWQARAYVDGSEWQVADILRHLADSERGMTNLMIQVKGGGEGVPPDFDLNRWNQRAVSKLQEKSPAELLDGMAASRAALLAFIDTLDESDWDRRGRHASLRIMSIEEVCHLIADHEQAHVDGIRQAAALG